MFFPQDKFIILSAAIFYHHNSNFYAKFSRAAISVNSIVQYVHFVYSDIRAAAVIYSAGADDNFILAVAVQITSRHIDSAPELLIVGEKDEHLFESQTLFAAISGSKKELHLIKGAPHTFRTPEHLAEIKNILDKWVEKIG